MDWLDRMNAAVDYIEANLSDEISYEKAARIACCSAFHFQRMFSFISGVPVSEYIRRRRLSLSAFDLKNADMKVIDVALKYGYESPEAFSRAFKSLHGIPPVLARDTGVVLKAFPKMIFSVSIKGGTAMKYRIEEKEVLTVFGPELKTTVVDGQCYRDIPAFWETCEKDGRCVALAAAAGKRRDELLDLGLIYDHEPDGGVSYMIGCFKKNAAVPSGFVTRRIPAQTWAIFQTDWHDGSDAPQLHDVWRRIYSEWFPVSGYEHSDCDYEMEVYLGNEKTGYSAEVWIPVELK